jgi:thymidylate synthase
MNKLDKQYTDLLQDILDNGREKTDRTGTGTISVFGRQIRHKMSEGFPLLTTKKMPFKTIVTELLWFLQGNTNIKYLVDNGCNIWTGDAYKNYINNPAYKAESVADLMGSQAGQLVRCSTQEEFVEKIKTDNEFADKWGELGPIYGKQWRKWKSASLEEQWGYGKIDGHPIGGKQYSKFNTNVHIDQIQNLINDLKTNPDSRRLMVNAWNVGELDQMVLPPCHYGFQVYTRELSLDERRKLAKYDSEFVSPMTVESWDRNNIPTRAISLMWNQRSVDTFLGLPFNIASYGLLLMMLADEVNMVPDELIGNLGDVHLYSNHIEQAKEQIGVKYTHEERTEMLKHAMGEENFDKAVDQLVAFGGGLSGYYESHGIPYNTREPYPLPRVHVRDGIYCSSIQDVLLFDYQSHPPIKAPLSN